MAETDKIAKKIEELEVKIGSLKSLVSHPKASSTPKVVSMRGLAKSKLTDEELDAAIEASKKSIFKGV